MRKTLNIYSAIQSCNTFIRVLIYDFYYRYYQSDLHVFAILVAVNLKCAYSFRNWRQNTYYCSTIEILIHTTVKQFEQIFSEILQDITIKRSIFMFWNQIIVSSLVIEFMRACKGTPLLRFANQSMGMTMQAKGLYLLNHRMFEAYWARI